MSIFDEYFDRIFVINLDARKDRWQTTLKEFEKVGITNYERFSAIKPSLNDVPKAWHAGMNFHFSNNKNNYLIGATGCKMSHVAILKKAKAAGYKNILVLEDDVIFQDNAAAIFEAATQQLIADAWDMLYLSGNHIRATQPESKNLKKLTGTFATHGYGIQSRMYDLVINSAMDYGREIDVYYANQIHRQYRCFCMEPHIIRQGAGYSDIVSRNVDYKL